MSNEPNDERWSPFPEGFVIPITGLLTLVFIVMAGMSVQPALSGSPSDLATPVIFAGVGLLCFRLRQRAIAAREND